MLWNSHFNHPLQSSNISLAIHLFLKTPRFYESQPHLNNHRICDSKIFLLFFAMFKTKNVSRHALEKSKSVRETQKILNHSFFPKHLKKVYPIGLQKSTSSLSLSSLSLSLSQNSNDSSQADSVTPLDEKISLALRLISPCERREPTVAKTAQLQQYRQPSPPLSPELGELKRCNWITKNSGMINFNSIPLFYRFGNFDLVLFFGLTNRFP